jgi:hypothetical protein
VRTYAYHDIGMMLDDLAAGKIGAVMKLAPVMRWFTRNRPALRVVQEGITDEKLGVAVRLGNVALRQAIGDAQAKIAGKERASPTGDEMAPGVIRCIHLFTGTDGRSHVERLDVPLGAVQPVTAAHFEESAAGSALDWHKAPCNHM